MGAALVVPVSGPYVATYGGYALGTQNDDGYVLMGTFTGQEINQSDAYGMTLVEAIWRGINWRVRFKGLEFNKPGVLASLQAFGAAGLEHNTLTPILANIGDRYSKFADPLVLTAILGNPPTMPQTLTAVNAVVAPNSNVEYLMTSKAREAPFELVLLPYSSTGSGVGVVNLSFTTT